MGIKRQLTAARTPQQNGVAERKNRTLLEAARSMQIQGALPDLLWDELIRTATYVLNRCETSSLQASTPYQTLYGQKPDLSKLRVIGCLAYVHIPRELRHKLSVKSRRTSLIGYDDKTKAYRCFDPTTRKILISRDVVFNEQVMFNFTPAKSLPNSSFDSLLHLPIPSSQLHHSVASPSTSPSSTSDLHSDSVSNPNLVQENPNDDLEIGTLPSESLPEHIHDQSDPPLHTSPLQESSTLSPPPSRRSSRTRELPVRLRHDYVMNFRPSHPDVCLVETTGSVDEDVTFSQAILDPAWKGAMTEEFDSLVQNDTWELVPLPPGKKAISARWVYRAKHELNPTRVRLKARLVARGFEQKHGIDFDDTFAPVVKWSTLRLIIALAAALGWKLHHMDVVTAFLNGKLKELIYMLQPPGFEVPGSEHLVCKLNRSIYGLKQSPRAWYEEIDAYLADQNWMRSEADHNLYFLHNQGKIVILLLFVDDLLVTGNDPEMISAVKQQLSTKYKMKDLGFVTRYLGIEFVDTSDGIFLHQQTYCEQLLQDFDMTDCKAADVPLPAGTVLLSDTSTPDVDVTFYCKLIGKLIYLTNSRPDLAYAVGILSRFMTRPQQKHLDSARHVLRYVKSTLDYGLLFPRSATLSLTGYTDSDHAACKETRRSIGAYLFQFAGATVTWSSKRQSTVSQSTTEAEYRALSDGTREGVFLRRLLMELKFIPEPSVALNCQDQVVLSNLSTATQPTQQDIHLNLHCDNQGSINLARNPIFHSRTKHIELQHHYIRERLLEGEVQLHYIPTAAQPADILTKPLPRWKFEQHHTFLGLRPLHSVLSNSLPA